MRARILDHLVAHPVDAGDRGCPGGHLTASVMLVHAPTGRVLLTDHPKLGRWMQLGGHLEPGDASVEAAAVRETVEESGQVHARVGAFLGAGVFEGLRCGGAVTRHYDLRWLVLTDDLAFTVSEESTAMGWFDLTGLPSPHDGDLRLLASQVLDLL